MGDAQCEITVWKACEHEGQCQWLLAGIYEFTQIERTDVR